MPRYRQARLAVTFYIHDSGEPVAAWEAEELVVLEPAGDAPSSSQSTKYPSHSGMSTAMEDALDYAEQVFLADYNAGRLA